jgi:hypothetical protein
MVVTNHWGTLSSIEQLGTVVMYLTYIWEVFSLNPCLEMVVFTDFLWLSNFFQAKSRVETSNEMWPLFPHVCPVSSFPLHTISCLTLHNISSSCEIAE